MDFPSFPMFSGMTNYCNGGKLGHRTARTTAQVHQAQRPARILETEKA